MLAAAKISFMWINRCMLTFVNFGFPRNCMGSCAEGGVCFSWPLPVVNSTKSSLLFGLAVL
jgi:hypothetical protein